MTEWTFCTKHEQAAKAGFCRECNGDRHLVQVVPKSALVKVQEALYRIIERTKVLDPAVAQIAKDALHEEPNDFLR